jgi:Flp pilus assembly protein TadD
MSETRLDTLRRMAGEKPDDPRLQFGLAVELLNAGHTREGVVALRAYLSLAADEGNAWGRLGAALADLGELDEAREAYARGIAVAQERGHDGLTDELKEALEDLG